MAARQQRDVPRLAIELGAVVHLDAQHARHVILEVGRLAALGFGDRLDRGCPAQPGWSTSRPTTAPPTLTRSTRPLGNSRTSSGTPKLLSSALSMFDANVCLVWAMTTLLVLVPRHVVGGHARPAAAGFEYADWRRRADGPGPRAATPLPGAHAPKFLCSILHIALTISTIMHHRSAARWTE